MLKLLGIATLISIVWVFLIKDFYGYNTSFQTLAGLNIFPLFAWAVGLFGAYSLFQVYMVKHDWKLIYKFLLFTAFYWIVLIAAETIMYHVFNFQNIATGIYSGLPICNCLHAPLFMQIGYFAIGPIYFLISSLLKNPYINVTKNPFTLKN